MQLLITDLVGKSKLPRMTYTHLTRDERYQISILAKAGHDQSRIANVMNRHRSTISRELRRNRGQRGYASANAERLCIALFLCQLLSWVLGPISIGLLPYVAAQHFSTGHATNID